jgi:hypothetical protein
MSPRYAAGAPEPVLFAAGITARRIADPFDIDPSLLAIINGAIKNGSAADLSGWQPGNAENSFANTHDDSVALEVSHQHPQLGGWCPGPTYHRAC